MVFSGVVNYGIKSDVNIIVSDILVPHMIERKNSNNCKCIYLSLLGPQTNTHNLIIQCDYLTSLTGKAGKQFIIKLHLCLSDGTFKPHRFAPNKNNIRQHWFKGEEGIADDGGVGKLL